MQIDYEGSIITLTRAEAEALLDASKATPEMLRDRHREELGLNPPASMLEKLSDRASELYYERELTVCISVEDGDDYERLGIYNGARGLRFDAERFAVLNEQED